MVKKVNILMRHTIPIILTAFYMNKMEDFHNPAKLIGRFSDNSISGILFMHGYEEFGDFNFGGSKIQLPPKEQLLVNRLNKKYE